MPTAFINAQGCSSTPTASPTLGETLAQNNMATLPAVALALCCAENQQYVSEEASLCYGGLACQLQAELELELASIVETHGHDQ